MCCLLGPILMIIGFLIIIACAVIYTIKVFNDNREE